MRARLAQLRASGVERSAALGYLLQSTGLLVNGARRSIWIHGERPEEFDAALGLIADVTRERPNVRLVLTSTVPATVAYLRRAFPDDHVGPAPWDACSVLGRFVDRLNPRLVILLEGGRSFGVRTLEEIRALRIPVAAVGVEAVGRVAGHLLRASTASPDTIRWTCVAAEVAHGLRAHGVPAASIAVTGALVRHAASHPEGTQAAVEALRDLLPDAPPARPVDQTWRIPSLRERAGASGVWKVASRAFSTRRLDDWPSLARRLGDPQAVLGLGNGPSSEDAQVQSCAHDCLVRINWRWRDRGVLTRPDLVFAGDPKTMHRVDGCVFGFWNVALERAMLMRRLVTRGVAPVEYVTLERLSPIIRDRDWPARPTNGALAIVAAAALRPRRLVIGGMDLFRHADGRYPGDKLARNQYSHVHREATDLAIVDLALAGFDGELVILSELFREGLARFRGHRDGRD